MGFGPNDRGVSVSFGPDIVQAFLHKEDMDLVVRAHQVHVVVLRFDRLNHEVLSVCAVSVASLDRFVATCTISHTLVSVIWLKSPSAQPCVETDRVLFESLPRTCASWTDVASPSSALLGLGNKAFWRKSSWIVDGAGYWTKHVSFHQQKKTSPCCD